MIRQLEIIGPLSICRQLKLYWHCQVERINDFINLYLCSFPIFNSYKWSASFVLTIVKWTVAKKEIEFPHSETFSHDVVVIPYIYIIRNDKNCNTFWWVIRQNRLIFFIAMSWNFLLVLCVLATYIIKGR